jgi:hypothetical protein
MGFDPGVSSAARDAPEAHAKRAEATVDPINCRRFTKGSEEGGEDEPGIVERMSDIRVGDGQT